MPALEPTLHFTRTRDGVRIALYNYRPETLEPHRCPVFLCHGMGSNRCDLDYPGPEVQSLAKYLHARGHDVWIVELRGAGRSSKPRFLLGKLRYDWVLDDYVVHDVPAAIAKVLEITRRPAVHWIGHSMGGMLAYPFLASSDPGLVRSCVTVGAPSLARLSHKAYDAALAGLWVLDYVPLLPWKHIGRVAAPLIKYLRPLIDRAVGGFVYNPANMTDEALARLLSNAVENLPATLVRQLGETYRTKRFRSHYGTFSINENLHRIETPLLVVAGSVDGMTPPEDLRFVYEHVASPVKEFVVIGRGSGATEEYGHVDLILGKNAHQDVFPFIQAWVARHELAEPRAAGPVAVASGEKIIDDPRMHERAAG